MFQILLWWPQTPCFVPPGALYLQFCGPHPRILFLSAGGVGTVCYLTPVLSCCDFPLSQPGHSYDQWLTTGLGWTVSCRLLATTTGCQQLVWTEVPIRCQLPQNVRLYSRLSPSRWHFATCGNIYWQVCEDTGPKQESTPVAGRERNGGRAGESGVLGICKDIAGSKIQLRELQFGQLNPIKKSWASVVFPPMWGRGKIISQGFTKKTFVSRRLRVLQKLKMETACEAPASPGRNQACLLLKTLPWEALGRKFQGLARAPAGEAGVRWAPRKAAQGQDAAGVDKATFIFTARLLQRHFIPTDKVEFVIFFLLTPTLRLCLDLVNQVK